MLAVKINIVLEISINSPKLFQNFANKTIFAILKLPFKISWLASYTAVQGSPERKKRENSKEKERNKENVGQMKIGGSYVRG